MDVWSRKFDSCTNCGTKEFPHKGKGYCNRCYKFSKKINVVKKWDYSVPSSLKECPLDTNRWPKERFNKCKNAYINKLKDCLRHIKARENMLAEDIYGINIEEQLAYIASRAGVKKYLSFAISNQIDHNFTPEQKKILFKILKNIENKLENRVPSIYSIFFDI